MELEKKYTKEFGKQVAKYLKISGLDINDFAKLIKSNADNVNGIIAGEVGITLGKMVKMANVFGIIHYDFANPKFPIPNREELIKNIKNVIEKREAIGKKNIDKKGLLANELNRLIKEGRLNQPNTAKNLLTYMDALLMERNPSEITSLLKKAPRNEYIILLRQIKGMNYFIHKDFKDKYATLSDEEILALIVPFKSTDIKQ